ncbi:hypothetical protein ACP4OV_007489 [Aristida adscensionis]
MAAMGPPPGFGWPAASGGGGGGGVHPLSDPARWGSWAHQGHRLWAYMSEGFWVYVYKVHRCPQPCSHDWTVCPYAHKGERARRRDPRRFDYLAVPCPDYRAAQQQQQLRLAATGCGGGLPPACVRGLRCRYAHGVFELWLHPSRFRTRMCEAGARCPRRICFFAHCLSELRGESDAVPAVGLPPPPPRLPRRPLPPPPPPRRVDMILQAMPNKLRLLHDAAASAGAAGAAATASSSSAITTAAVAAPAPALDTPPADDEDAGSNSSRRVDEDSVIGDYPYFDLIMDIVLS